ncbi:MAG TPA: hypothetical protein VFS40_06000 [Gemmatimonadales bacterium]|nr:hypothetical protein [Gemmatimonadales bacterium]
MPFRQTTVSGFPALALRNAEIEVVAVPALGMKLTNLRRHRGREWLWRSEQIPLAPPVPGASYVETADSGGWDECFPTVGPCPLPAFEADGAPPASATGVMLPDHGELWSAGWRSAIYEHGGATTLTGTTSGTLLPYEFTRELTLDPREPVVRFHYHVRNTGDRPFPWIWSSHPLFNIQPGTRLELPTVHQVKLDAVHGRPDLAVNDTVSWPGAIGGRADAFVVPEPPALTDATPAATSDAPGVPGGWALKCFGDVGVSGRMALVDPRLGERLELRVDPAEVPQVGVWINIRGWAPTGKRPYFNLALEPCIGAPDRLDRAIEAWRTAQTLAPGEEREWRHEVHLPESEEA